jgi:hypothetical protein
MLTKPFKANKSPSAGMSIIVTMPKMNPFRRSPFIDGNYRSHKLCCHHVPAVCLGPAVFGFPPFAVSSVRTSVVKKSMHTKTSRCERAKSSLKTDCFCFGAGETPERSLTWNEDPPATDFRGCINVAMSTRRFVDGLGAVVPKTAVLFDPYGRPYALYKDLICKVLGYILEERTFLHEAGPFWEGMGGAEQLERGSP